MIEEERKPEVIAGETVTEWFTRYVELPGSLGARIAQHLGDYER